MILENTELQHAFALLAFPLAAEASFGMILRTSFRRATCLQYIPTTKPQNGLAQMNGRLSAFGAQRAFRAALCACLPGEPQAGWRPPPLPFQVLTARHLVTILRSLRHARRADGKYCSPQRAQPLRWDTRHGSLFQLPESRHAAQQDRMQALRRYSARQLQAQDRAAPQTTYASLAHGYDAMQ